MSYDYSNFTQFGIKNDVERYAYAGWLIFVVVCSFLGDTIILVASIKYKAFNLHKIVTACIQHIAVCDLLYTVLRIFPAIVSIFDDSAVSSEILNYSSFFITYMTNPVSAYLIAAMSLSKLLLLKYPLRAGSWLKEHAHTVCAGIWIACLSVPALHLFVDKDDVTFDYRVYTCAYTYTKNIWAILLPATALLVLFAPNVTIIVATVLLIKEARRAVRRTHENLRWQGILPVVLTATVYSISYFPVTVYLMAEPVINKDTSVPSPFFVEFYRVAFSVMCFNVLANFFVYSLTVRSFQSFLKIRFRQTASFLSTSVISVAAGKYPSPVCRC